MRAVFRDVRINLGSMRNARGSRQFGLTAEQCIVLWDALNTYWNFGVVKICGDEISMGDCDSDDIRWILSTIDDTFGLDVVLDAGAVVCMSVDDLDLDSVQEIADYTDLSGFRESDWEDEEEASE